MTVKRDNFTRANSGTLGANWTANSGAFTTILMGIASNTAVPGTTDGSSAASFWSADTFSPNQYSQVPLGGSALGSNLHGGGPTCRASAGDNYYRFFGNLQNIANNVGLIKVVNGVASSLKSATVTLALNDFLRMEAIGNTLYCFINGKLIFWVVDTDLPTGSVGLAAAESGASPTVTLLNWEGGDIVPFSVNITRDNFTRANSGTLGSQWTAISSALDTQTMGITSNRAQVQATGGRAMSFYSGATFRDDQYCEAIANGVTGTNTHLDIISVRASAGGNYYALSWNLVNSGTTLTLFKSVAGVFTAISSAVNTFAVIGSLFRLEATGTQLLAYIDGNLALSGNDEDLTSGSVGVGGDMTTAGATAFMNSFEGGNLVWKRSGTVIPIGANGGTEEPSAVYEANPQILSANPDGKVFKMWFTDGWSPGSLSVAYAEANDGVNYTLGGSVITGSDIAHGYVAHFGNTYYAYYVPSTATNAQFDVWQSSDGKTGWTKTNTAVLSIGGVGTWDHGGVFNPYVWFDGVSTYYMLYTGRAVTNYSVGLASASSPTGPFTKLNGAQPVIADGGANAASPSNGKLITKSGNTYSLWGFGAPSGGSNQPTDIKMFTSTDPTFINWSPNSKNPFYQRVLLDEGTNLSSGQVADPCPVEMNGIVFLYHDAITTQVSGKIHINMSTAPFTLTTLAGMLAGNTIITGSTGQPGVTVNFSGAASGSVISDSAGTYVVPIAVSGSYTLTPALAGYTFTPASSNQSVTTSDITGVNFTPSVIAAETLSMTDAASATLRQPGSGIMFFCAQSNAWVISSCTQTPPSPHPPGNYPVFDPIINAWITSGDYGGTLPTKFPYFELKSNSWRLS